MCSCKQGVFLYNAGTPPKSENSHWCVNHRRILRPHSKSFLCPNDVLCSRRIQFRTPCCIWLSRLLRFLQSGSVPVFSVPFVTLPPLSIPPLTWLSLPLGSPGAVLVMGDWSQVVHLWWGKIPAGVLSSPPPWRPSCQLPAGGSLSRRGCLGALDASTASQASPARGCSFLLGKE